MAEPRRLATPHHHGHGANSATRAAALTQPGLSRPGPSQRHVRSSGKDKLQQLLERGSVQHLMKGVKSAKALLGKINPVLGSLGTNPELLKLIEAVTALEAKPMACGPVIGVVGMSGSGKSTLINALLGEENLVPTSSTEACTAVITKFLHNDCDDPDKKYRAEVDFLSKEDWKMDLDTFGGDVRVSELNETLSDELLARMQAVYPHINESSFVGHPELASELLALPHVREVLGSTVHLSARTAKSLSEKLQPYIAATQGSSTTGRKPELWPLVKVVRIFTKAAVLRTGLILVDLPGSGDSNPARAAVAGRFLKDCNGIWIVARMDRAATETTVFELLGTQFLQQLQLDGKFSTITLICTKSDEIKEDEAVRNLQGDKGFLERRSEIEARIAKAKQALANNQTNTTTAKHRDAELKSTGQRLTWREKVLDKALNKLYQTRGKENMVAVARSPPRLTLKRKQRHASVPAAKRIAYTPEVSDTGKEDLHGLEDIDVRAMDIDPGTVMMTEDAIRTEQATVAESLVNLEEQESAIARELETLDTERQRLEKQLKSLEPQLLKHVIETRNAAVIMKARQQYSVKLRKLDQEAMDDDVPSKLKSRQEYDEAAKQLKVFCVSAHAYMLLVGPTKAAKNGFDTEEETQVPLLQRYAIGSADDYRAATCRYFLNEFSELIATLLFQVVSDETPLNLGVNVREQELEHLETSLASLEEDLDNCERAFATAVVKSMHKIFAKFRRASGSAKEEAGKTLDRLFVKTKGNEDYVSYQTFLAMCQPNRNGVFKSEATKGKKGVINLNAELTRPFRDTITAIWSVVFGSEIPDAIDKLGRDAAETLDKFNAALKSRKQLNTGPSFDALQTFIKILGARSRDNGIWKQFVVDNQKSVNRLITETLREQMEGTYKACLETPAGAGRYERIKQLVRERVNDDSVPQADMFQKTASEVQKGLSRIVKDLRQKIREKHTLQGERLPSEKLARPVPWVISIRRRCNKLVNGTQVFADVKETRNKLHVLLTSADDSFGRILAGEPADTQVIQDNVEMMDAPN